MRDAHPAFVGTGNELVVVIRATGICTHIVRESRMLIFTISGWDAWVRGIKHIDFDHFYTTMPWIAVLVCWNRYTEAARTSLSHQTHDFGVGFANM